MSFTQTADNQLWLPGSTNNFRKAAPPKTGPAFGDWSGRELSPYFNLPGGAILQFDLSRLTLADFRAMRQHYQINISQSLLMFSVHQIDWFIECEDPRIREAVEENLREVWTRLVRALSQAFWAGYSPIALEYENDPISSRIKVTKFKDLIPEECSVHWKKVPGYAPPGHVKPNRYIYDGINQGTGTYPIPPENSLWYPMLMENGDMWGRQLLKPAFPSWFFSQLIHLFANRYFERFGEPLPVGRAPFDDDVDMGDGTMQSGRQVMETIVSQIRNRAAVILPSDRTPGGSGDKNDYEYSIDYLESQMRGADFERYLTRLDEEMALALFTPILLFRTADVGSYNLGQAHEKSYQFALNTIVSDMKEYIDRYVIDRLVDFNFSPKAPRARFHFRKLGKDKDETLRAIIQGAIQQEFIAPDIEELGIATGLKFHEVEILMDNAAPQREIENDLSTESPNDKADPDGVLPAPGSEGSDAAPKSQPAGAPFGGSSRGTSPGSR